MAAPFQRADLQNVGTSATVLAGAVPSAKVWIALSLLVSNKLGTDDVAVDIFVRNGSTDTYLVRGLPLLVGAAEEVIAPGKRVSLPGDIYYVRASVANGVDATLSYMFLDQ